MATHAPITGAPTRAPLLPRFHLANRAAIEQEIERLILLLDTADGDCDLEEDDHSGDYDEREQDWPWVPRYGVDQTRLPTNVHEAEREHHAELLGLVRTSTGWHQPH